MGNNESRSADYFKRYSQLNLNEPSHVFDQFLFLGGHWSFNNPELLSHIGITHVLNLAQELPLDKRYSKNKIKVKHIKAIDSESYYLRNHFDESFNFIDKARDSGGKFKVFIRCYIYI